MKAYMKELANIEIEPLELAGVVFESRYAIGRLGAHGATHVVIEHTAVRSDDPEIVVGSVVAYALCAGTREAHALRGGLHEANCDRCDEAARKIVQRRRADRRRKGSAA